MNKKKPIIVLLLLVISGFSKANELTLANELKKANQYTIQSNSDAVFKTLRAGLKTAINEKNTKYEGLFYTAIADEYLFINQIDSIDYYYEKAAKIFEKLKIESELIKAELGLLELARRTNPSSTMDKYLDLLNRARAINDVGTYYLILEKIILVNNGMENYKEAFAQTHECINYYKSIKDEFHLAIKYRELGGLYFTHFTGREGPLYEKDSCIYYNLKAIELSTKIGSIRNIVFAYQRLSWLMSYSDLKLALKYALIADSLDQLYNIQSPQLPNIMSITLFKMGKVKEAIIKSRKALDLGLKAKQLFIGIQASDQLCIYYKAEKKYDSALYYKEISQMINDSIRSQKHYKDAVKMQAKLEFDKENYQKEIIQQENDKRQKLILYFTFSSLIFLLIILFLIYRAYLINKKSVAIISIQNQEKTMLIKEIHHRVKNNLTVISSILDLQKRNIKDEQMLDIFKDAKSRINSMALVHKNLYEQDNFTTINTQIYFKNLYNTVSSAYKLKETQIDTTIACEDVNINIDTLIPLALITNELLTNSFKYAFEGRNNGTIILELKNNKNGFEMNYRDNGIGLTKNTETNTIKEGLGTLLITGLTKQLDGTLVKNTSQNGLHYTINFKGINV